ncbi:MAG: LysR family transcriptional regulator [Clostridia bacterium]
MEVISLHMKIWLEAEGEKILGKGPIELLRLVDELGSLRQAAMSLAMSYSKAWNLIVKMEKRWQMEILARKTGGQGGGSSSLTEEARKLVIQYENFEQEANSAVVEIFARHFPEQSSLIEDKKHISTK